MKYILVIVCFIFLLFLYIIKKKKVICKVKCLTKEEKLSYINAALNNFGFAFDEKQDIVISKNNSWQRNLGYMDFYDKNADLLNIIVDAEPIYFHYDNKEYRIEFWKGQYGMTTGAEIGIYIREDDSKLPKGIYRCANDEECLPMCFLLFKNCFLFKREEYTWWLTGFKIGMYSKKEELKLNCCIRFPNCKIKEKFIEGLKNAGYQENQIIICEDIVCFEICKPHNYELNKQNILRRMLTNLINKFNCYIYQSFTRYFNTTLDKLTYLRLMFPFIYHFVLKISVKKCIKHIKKRKCKK